MQVLITVIVLVIIDMYFLYLIARKADLVKGIVNFLGRPWIGYLMSAILIGIFVAIGYVVTITGTWYYWTNHEYTFGVMSKMQVTQQEDGLTGLRDLYKTVMSK